MMKLLFPALLLLQNGCATIIQGSSQKMLITSDPPGAVVSVDGVPLGITPVVAMVARKQPHTLSAALDGYPGDSLRIVPKSNFGLLALNLLMIYGLPVDLITGAHRSFRESQISFQLATRDSVAQGEIQRVPSAAPPAVPMGEIQRAASSAPPVPIGSRIRVRHTELASPVVTVGTLRGFASDTLLVASEPPHALFHWIPLSSTQSIELSMGSARAQSAGRGAGRGALAGLLLGGIVGLVMDAGSGDGGYNTIMLGGLSAMAGTIAGALLGTADGTTERWMNVACCTTAPATPPAANAQARPAPSATTSRP